MALNQSQVNKLYHEMLGRDAVFGDASDYDADYWVGKTEAQVRSGISGSSEFKNRAALVANAGDAGITEAELDKMVLPGGWKTEHHTDFANLADKDLFDFNRDNTWKGGIESSGGNWAKEQNIINKQLGTSGAKDWATNITGGGGDDTVKDDTVKDTTKNNNNIDLDAWWAGIDKPWLTKTDDTTTSNNDDFMKLMMFMAMMRPQGGGWGGSQYGYGGLNPGGVQSAYNPMANLSGYMDAFKTLPGISTSTISTGSN